MARGSRPTDYAGLTPGQARLVLAAMFLVGGLFVGIALSPLAQGFADQPRQIPGADPQKGGDLRLYRAKVDRVHAGENYYDVAGDEMRTRGYPTGSVFNWRTPLLFWLLGWLPEAALGHALLGGLGLALLATAFEALAREEDNLMRRPLACAVLLTGPLMPCVLSNTLAMPVLWAGILIALSICAYGLGRPRFGVGLGLAAVFVRELAMPYCAVAMALAWWNRRRGELLAWMIGLALWAAHFAWHCHQVLGRIGPGDRVHEEGWLQFGGAAFVIATAQMNTYLLLLPQWITALYLVAALLGFAGWSTPLGMRAGLTVSLFLTAFALVGHDFNQYWGSLIAPLLCFGVARFPASLRDLWQVSRRCVSRTAFELPARQ